jgi:predicted dehydrogenase
MSKLRLDTLAHGIIKTSGNTLINITSTMTAASEQAVTIEMYGERGTAVYNDRPMPHAKFIGIRVHKEGPPVWGAHALQRSLAGFARWVLNDQLFLTPVASALPVLAAVDGIYRSAQSGKRETIELKC